MLQLCVVPHTTKHAVFHFTVSGLRAQEDGRVTTATGQLSRGA
jgi:hypothetical protein